jgi:hypothetical protein
LTLNFGILGFLFLAVMIVLVLVYHHRQTEEARRGFFSLMNVKFSFAASLVLLLLGLLSIHTLNNYFFADEHLYRNTDHHALRLDGITIGSQRGFVLAGASKQAFFDDERMGGSVALTDNSGNDSVQLKLSHFTRPIFINQYNAEGRCTQRTCVNCGDGGNGSLLCFSPQDTLLLRTKNGNVYSFYMQVVGNDSVDYHLVLPDGTDCLTDEHRFMTQGLPLSVLTQGSYGNADGNWNVDFSDLHILRSTMHMQVRKDSRISTYQDIGFVVEVQNGNNSSGLNDRRNGNDYVVEGRTGRTPWQSLRKPGTMTLSMPMDTFFSFGYGSGSTQPVCFSRDDEAGSRLALLFKMPCYHYLTQLPGEEESSIFVRTSMLNPGAQGNAFLAELPENEILFDLFSHADNVNNMRPLTLSFTGGPTTQPMEFLCTIRGGQPEQTVAAGERIDGVNAISNRHGVQWLMSVENLKDTAPWSPFGIKLRMALFVLMLALLVLWGGATNMTTKGAARRNLFTTVEFVAYAVTIYLVAFRWFLLWRTSVFPPVEDVSYFEFYGLFRNGSNGHWLTVMMVIMVVGMAVGKALVFWRPWRAYGAHRTYRSYGTYGTYGRPWVMTALLILGVGAVFVLSRWVFRGTPVLRISLPVFTYLLYTVVIDRWLSRKVEGNAKGHISGIFRLEDRDRLRAFWQQHTPLRLIMAHVATAAVFAAMLLVIDSGYGILFLTFAVFWTLWLMQQHVGYYMRREHWRVGVIFILLLVMGWLIYSYKDIIGFADRYDTLPVLAVMGAAGLAVGFVISWIVSGGNGGNRRTLNDTAKAAAFHRVLPWLFPVAVALAFVLGGWGFRHYLKDGGEHTAQRIAVHFAKPDDVMEKITDDATEYRYLQAALNHSVIGQYTDRGDKVKLFFEGGHGFFKMQPHSKVGALWNAQLTDISLVRFVVSEHSQYLPLVLIAFFLLMLVAAARQPLFHRWARSLLIQIPLLLFVHSLLIWMATTQRFIFLGQDFPMVSINSRLTLVYYFGLVGTWVLVAVYEKRNLYKLYTFDADGRPQNNDAADPLLPAGSYEPYESYESYESYKTYKTHEPHEPHAPHQPQRTPNYWRFTIARTDARRAAVVLLLCMLGAAFASRGTTDNSLELTRLMNQLAQRVGIINDLLLDYQDRTAMRLRHDMSGSMSAFSRSENIDSLLADFPFGQRLWRHYIERDSRNNNSHLILHTHLNREKKVVLAMVNRFHNPQLPVPVDDQWKGNLVAPDGSYLARNIMLNGRRTLIYPQGNAFFWLRHLAAELQYNNRYPITNNRLPITNNRLPITNNRYPLANNRYALANNGSAVGYSTLPVFDRLSETSEEPNEEDVALTLSPALTDTIYSHLAQATAARSSVIVATGRGDVMAMVDYDRDYAFDPNDNRRIQRFTDSLYMYGMVGSEVERRAFGNKNLMHIQRGPGSTQKPLTWTAVASRVELPWKHLYIASYNGMIPSADDRHFSITHFNGMPFLQRHPFVPLKSDENGGNRLGVRGYMTYSSNVYNALMAYIGSFTDEQLREPGFLAAAPRNDGHTLLAKINPLEAMRTEVYRQRFPLIVNANGNRNWNMDGELLTLNKPISAADQDNCLFREAMEEMFIGDEADAVSADGYVTSPGNVLDADKRLSGYAYAETSFLQSRQGRNTQLLMELAVRSTAIGAQVVWEVTPWKMAEAYARMASLNDAYRLTIFGNPRTQTAGASYRPFAALSSGYRNARSSQLLGMSDVMTKGTGIWMRTLLHVEDDGNDSSNRVGRYYIYAKTGTISASRRETDRHRFGVIIADSDLATTPVDRLDDVRYVVLFFTVDSKAQWDMYRKVIKDVMESNDFKAYME